MRVLKSFAGIKWPNSCRVTKIARDKNSWAALIQISIHKKFETQIGDIFEKRLRKTIVREKLEGVLHAGPAKTLERSIAKCHEYRSDYHLGQASKR